MSSFCPIKPLLRQHGDNPYRARALQRPSPFDHFVGRHSPNGTRTRKPAPRLQSARARPAAFASVEKASAVARYALATLSVAPLLISGARRKAMRHAKDGFGFAGWLGVRGLRVRLVTS